MESANTSRKKIITFIILTFSLSAIPYYALISAGSMKAAGTIWVVFEM